MKAFFRTGLIVCGTIAAIIAASTDAFAQKVLIVAAEDPAFVTDVRAKLVNTHQLTAVDVFDASVATPTLDELRPYDAVLTWSNSSYLDADALGDVLADYADLGKGVVQAEFAFYSGSPFAELRLAGRWQSGGYAAFTSADSGFDAGLTLVADVPAHPLLTGVASFNGGTAILFHSAITVPPCGQVVAHWSNGVPLVVVGCPPKALTVGLNFYPPSSDARQDFWDASTDGARLMANALQFVAPGSANRAPTVATGPAQTAEATSAAGATFTVTASASDPDSDPLTLTWSGAVSGTGSSLTVTLPPPAGATSQTYLAVVTVSDGRGGTATANVSLTVTDTTGPVLGGVPSAPITATATSPSGAVVPLPPVTATDAVDGSRPVSCAPSGLFPVGDTTVTCTASDSRGNARAASFVVRVSAAASTPGHMRGAGRVDQGSTRYEFAFDVFEHGSRDGGGFAFAVNGPHGSTSAFVGLTIGAVAFTDDPHVQPGHSRRPLADTVQFTGTGAWKGHGGYRYSVFAVDAGEPGRADTFRVVVTAPDGSVVAQVSGNLSAGNIQSLRVR
ncbi:MAG TPA: HYR domain-containing protein [Vicinamibacterales bacterium]|jgi:hypothetical protein